MTTRARTAKKPSPAKKASKRTDAKVKARDPGRRQRIMDVAKRHFTQHGYKGASLDDIAREAGCAKGALYLEFSDKQQLLHEIMTRSYHEVIARYHAEVDPIESPLERLVAALRFSFDQYATQPLLIRMAKEMPALGELVPSGLIAEAAMQVDVVNRWLADAKKQGELRDDVDIAVIPFVIAVLKWAPMNLQQTAQVTPVPVARTLEAVLDLFRAGIAKHPSRPPSSSASKKKGRTS